MTLELPWSLDLILIFLNLYKIRKLKISILIRYKKNHSLKKMGAGNELPDNHIDAFVMTWRCVLVLQSV